jgi:ABC-type branched-subunit amino acid transport system permease subunit
VATARMLLPARDTRALLIKWVVGLLVPVMVFTFVWSGEQILNNVLLGLTGAGSTPYDTPTLIQAAIFIVVFYASMMALVGYLVAADSGNRGMIELWIDLAVFTLVPMLLALSLGLVIGLALCAVIWPLYFIVRRRVVKALHYTPPPPLKNLKVLDAEQRAVLVSRAAAGGFWFGAVFGVVWLIVDLIYYISGALPTLLLILAVVRTVILPVAGYFLGRLGGVVAVRRTLAAKNSSNGNQQVSGDGRGVSQKRQLEVLSTSRAREEARDLVPNDLPLRSSGAQRFYLILIVAFVLFYPVLDPFLFGFGTSGRLASYGEAGYYVILALGLNIVVGFAGLLDLGYVAFFVIGSYSWGIIGSAKLTQILNLAPLNPHLLSALFWPMVLAAALIAAFFGVLLGAPTLRLRGDYLAIVTLGFGEIVPIVFLELDQYTNGTNGIVGVNSPAFPGVTWSIITPVPYYYLILALIALTIFANVRLRDSRLGRAWIAMREDEVAAASSGVNLRNTKLFAFAAGAFFSGIAGAYYSAKLGGVSPDNFSFGNSVIYLAMVVIGGIGSIPGVIVGALAVYSINILLLAQLDTLASDPTNPLYTLHNAIAHFVPGFSFGNVRNLLFGIILVVIMIFRPEGLIPSARRRRELHHAEGDGEVELGTLDVTPGSAEFEAEVRIE